MEAFISVCNTLAGPCRALKLKPPLFLKLKCFVLGDFQFGAELGHLQMLRSFCDIIGEGESMVNTCLRQNIMNSLKILSTHCT